MQRDVLERQSSLLRLRAVGRARIREGDILEGDLTGDPRQLDGVRAVAKVGSGVQQLEDLLERGHARLVGGVELRQLLDRVEQVR